jgi:hypothetical protein
MVVVKGMYYNSLTHRWEGNEEDLILFDVFKSDDSFDSTISLPPYTFETEKHATLHLGLVNLFWISVLWVICSSLSCYLADTKARGSKIRPLTKRVVRIAITYSAYSGRARYKYRAL